MEYKIGQKYNNFLIVGKDKNNKNKLLCKCDMCGYITSKYKNNIARRGCGVCCKQIIINGYNDALTTNPELKKYVIDEKEFFNYAAISNHKVHAKCPDCGDVKITTIKDLTYNSYSCNRCSDKRSYPNRFMYNLLTQLKIEFEAEKSFKWSERKIYDFYIKEKNLIIEMHGGQHYKKGFSTFKGAVTLLEQKENDKKKEILAIKNKITNYIIIDSSISNIEYLRDSIIKSKLLKIIGIKENAINWKICDEFANKNITKEICLYYLKHPEYNTNELGVLYHLTKQTIISYLKKGTILGWCNYDPKLKMKDNGIKNSPFISKCIICDEHPNVIFKNAKEASEYIKAKDGIDLLINSIRRVASGERNSYKKYHFKYLTND